MRKNGLARLEANAVARGARALAARWFQRRPVVPEADFQDETEPYPGHWRSLPEPWAGLVSDEQLREALDALPKTWREVLLRHDGPAGKGDDIGAADSGLTPMQERNILAQARAALREALDAAQHRAAP